MPNVKKLRCVLYLIRHGESTANAHYAKSESPFPITKLGADLSELGIEQVKQLSQELRHIRFDVIFSSDFIRARRTAEIIATEQKLKVILTKFIREQRVGSMEGKMTDSIHEEIKKLQKNLTDREKMKIKFAPDMESEEEMLKRFMMFVNKMTLRYAGKVILMVTHEHLMRTFLIHIGFAKYDDLPHGSIRNTGYLVLETDGINFYVKKIVGIKKNFP